MDDLRRSYDRIAATYAARLADELAGKPFDRSLLDRFAVTAAPLGPIADVGCGPGHVAAYLRDRGADVLGIDLSPAMVAEAQRRFSAIPFRAGDMTAPHLADASLGGIVAFYAIIHVPREQHGAMFAAWCRALRPGGFALVSYHVGDEVRHLDEWWGETVSVDFRFFSEQEIAETMTTAGFEIRERTVRAPYPDVEVATHRAYILARRPADAPDAADDAPDHTTDEATP